MEFSILNRPIGLVGELIVLFLKIDYKKEKRRIIMKKSSLVLVAMLSTLGVFAADKIAVVDLQQLVSSSSQVKQLKQEHAKKNSRVR